MLPGGVRDAMRGSCAVVCPACPRTFPDIPELASCGDEPSVDSSGDGGGAGGGDDNDDESDDDDGPPPLEQVNFLYLFCSVLGSPCLRTESRKRTKPNRLCTKISSFSLATLTLAQLD